jgi:hypothetical protein
MTGMSPLIFFQSILGGFMGGGAGIGLVVGACLQAMV